MHNSADRLALAVSHGRISYDLLMFFFLPGDDILTIDMDDNGMSDKQPVSLLSCTRSFLRMFLSTRIYVFRPPLPCMSVAMTACKLNPLNLSQDTVIHFCSKLISFHHSDKIGKAFYLQGYGVAWDGTEYKQYSLRRLIPKFPGTKNIDELICSVLSEEKKIVLQARGKLYASLSGIHYKSCESGTRIDFSVLPFTLTMYCPTVRPEQTHNDRPEGVQRSRWLSSRPVSLSSHFLFPN